MTARNFPEALAYVWLPANDAPAQGPHTTEGDRGGLTNGGVTEASWASAAASGLVTGMLYSASVAQLTKVLQIDFWDGICNALPNGLDLLVFNGVMMSGYFPSLFQQSLGFIGSDVDGNIGPRTLAAAGEAEPVTLIRAVTGRHYAYLQTLENWTLFAGGWTQRLIGVRNLAIKMIGQPA